MNERHVKERFEDWYVQQYGQDPDWTRAKVHELFDSFKAGYYRRENDHGRDVG